MTSLHSYSLRKNNDTVSLQDIEQFENEIGMKLPNDYIKFITEFGLSTFGLDEEDEEDGCKYVCFSIESYYKGGEGILDVFSGFVHHGAYSLLNSYLTYEQRLFPAYIPIAYDPGGNVICMSLNSDNYESIYFVDHEEMEENRNSKVYLIATSFADFINSLHTIIAN